MTFIVLAIDALEIELVERFGCSNLMQEAHGRTDISEFSQPRTMVLWSSFLTGENKEKEILAKGNKEMWNTKIEKKDSFLSEFKSPLVIDLPGYSYDKTQHERERAFLKDFFGTKDQAKKDGIREAYNKNSFEHHRKIKEEFFEALKNADKHDLIIGYFSVADVIGHLNFGNDTLMKTIYMELDDIARKVRESGFNLLVLSDHGMEAVGIFGDHSNHGFWSANFPIENARHRITDFGGIITGQAKK